MTISSFFDIISPMTERTEKFRHSIIAPAESRIQEIESAREKFAGRVQEVKVLYRRAQRLDSMWSSVTVEDGAHISDWEGPGNFKRMLSDLGVNVEQLDRVFGMVGDENPSKPVFEIMAGFKEGGHQALADLLGKPIQYGWYDGFFENDTFGEPIKPRDAKKIDPRYRIWKTDAEKEQLKKAEEELEDQIR